LLLITCAPSRAATFSDKASSPQVAELASTRMVLQAGQIALATSRSSAVSCAQPVLVHEYPDFDPSSLYLAKQPLAEVRGGSA
jgi:hypothetical protein